MAKQIIKGDDLMLFVSGSTGYKAIAYATSHILSINGETSDTSSKDHGKFRGVAVTRIAWELTTENLYTKEDFQNLFTYMTNGTELDVMFQVCAKTGDTVGNDGIIDSTNHSPMSDNAITGKVVITSLSANANTGENATFSATLTGTGAIKLMV